MTRRKAAATCPHTHTPAHTAPSSVPSGLTPCHHHAPHAATMHIHVHVPSYCESRMCLGVFSRNSPLVSVSQLSCLDLSSLSQLSCRVSLATVLSCLVLSCSLSLPGCSLVSVSLALKTLVMLRSLCCGSCVALVFFCLEIQCCGSCVALVFCCL